MRKLLFGRVSPARRRFVRAALLAAAGSGLLAAGAHAETYSWVGTTGASPTSPSGGSWNNAVGTNVWASGANTTADTNTIPANDPSTILSFGGSGSSSTPYTSTDNINSDLQLNQIINNNSQNNGGAIAQSISSSGFNSARLVFVANGTTGPTATNTGTANLTINVPVKIDTTLTGNGSSPSGLTQFNGNISGTGSFVVNGTNNACRFDMGGTNTFTGGATNDINNITATLTRGQLLAGKSSSPTSGSTITNSPFGTGTLVINTISGGTALIRATTNNSFTLANPVTLAGDLTIGANTTNPTPTILTLTSPITITGGTRALTINAQYTPTAGVLTNGDQTFAGAVGEATSGLGLIKAGPSVLAFSGAASNTYTGTTTVNQGVLAMGKTGGATAVNGPLVVGDNSTSGNTLAAKDTLLYRQSNQVADTATITLNGALLNLNSQSEGTTITSGAGPLTSQNSSVIDMGSGTSSILHFADSSAKTWSGSLQVLGWDGDAAGGGGDQLLFGTTASGLTASQLARISFIDPAGQPSGTYGAQMLSNGEVVPTPEPTSIAVFGLATGLLALRRRRA